MHMRMIAPAILSAALLSTPVLAATAKDQSQQLRTLYSQEEYGEAAAMTPSVLCSDLKKQFDAAIKTHEDAPDAIEAKSLRVEGRDYCAGGDTERGIAKLEQAIRALGLEPSA
jgi:hypothetical protein